MPLGRILRTINDDHTHGVGGKKRGQRRQDWLSRVDVIDLLERCSVHNISQTSGDEVNFSCPFSGHDAGDSRPSAYMNTGARDRKKTSVFKCHGCGRSGNAIGFYAEYNNVSKQEARIRLREIYAPDWREPKGGSISAEFEQRYREHLAALNEQPYEAPVIPWERYWEICAFDWRAAESDLPNVSGEVADIYGYMLKRGFTVETLIAWKIGFDQKADRFSIPVCNEAGECVGWKGRTWQPKAKVKNKYMIAGDREGKRKRYGFEPYLKSEVVFGLHMAVALARKLDVSWAVLVEGELDAIALWQAGIPAVSTGSSSVSETQQIVLRDNFDELVIFFDTDDSGEKAVYGYYNDSDEWKPGLVEKLLPFMRMRVVEDHDKDPAALLEDDDLDELRRLVRDAVPVTRLLAS